MCEIQILLLDIHFHCLLINYVIYSRVFSYMLYFMQSFSNIHKLVQK